jgi:glycosyltransferase involved in cell wall biosynthesis
MPKISVILPAYNAEKYLGEAIESILNQSFKDFEFLIFNDGSTDTTKEIIDGYNDKRIIAYHSDINKGYVHWLNEGIKQAKGKYIARMDADDISFTERFQLQFDYMETHPEIGLCGSQIEIIGSGELVKKPLTDNEIRWWFFIGNPIAHPVVMIRKEVLSHYQLFYKNELKPAEDYEMWCRMSHNTKITNLQNILLKYRYHPNQESTANACIQNTNFDKGYEFFLKSIEVSVNRYKKDWIEMMFNFSLKTNLNTLLKIIHFFNELEKSNKATQFFGEEIIKIQKVLILSKYFSMIEQYSPKLLYFLINKSTFSIVRNSKIGFFSFIIKSILSWKTRQ